MPNVTEQAHSPGCVLGGIIAGAWKCEPGCPYYGASVVDATDDALPTRPTQALSRWEVGEGNDVVVAFKDGATVAVPRQAYTDLMAAIDRQETWYNVGVAATGLVVSVRLASVVAITLPPRA